MKRRQFIKASAAVSALALLPNKQLFASSTANKLRTAHIGVGGMGMADLKSISSHEQVEVAFLCDVDSNNLAKAQEMFPNAKVFSDYRKMLEEVASQIDAVIVPPEIVSAAKEPVAIFPPLIVVTLSPILASSVPGPILVIASE